jgi:hypothetical protein
MGVGASFTAALPQRSLPLLARLPRDLSVSLFIASAGSVAATATHTLKPLSVESDDTILT